jgi:hypothetical protein
MSTTKKTRRSRSAVTRSATRNAAVFFDTDFYERRNLSAGRNGSRRLNPSATTGTFTGNDSDRRRCVFRNWRISSLA